MQLVIELTPEETRTMQEAQRLGVNVETAIRNYAATFLAAFARSTEAIPATAIGSQPASVIHAPLSEEERAARINAMFGKYAREGSDITGRLRKERNWEIAQEELRRAKGA